MIKVSIITVCFNSEKTIRRTIESVLKQTYENIEYIIVDGASTDGTLSIIQEYEPLFAKNMKYISEPDDGLYFAMNKGINLASGSLIGLLNSDDTYEPDAVEKIVAEMSEDRYQVLYGFARVYTDNKVDTISMVSHHFIDRRMINHTACFVTKNVYDDIAMFDTKYPCVADYDLILRLSKDRRVEFVPVFTLVSNFYSGGISSTGKAYMDLIELKKAYGMISKKDYYKIVVKNKIYKLLKGKVS